MQIWPCKMAKYVSRMHQRALFGGKNRKNSHRRGGAPPLRATPRGLSFLSPRARRKPAIFSTRALETSKNTKTEHFHTFHIWNPLAICWSVLKKNCARRDNSKSYQRIITKFDTKVEPIAAHMPITFGHSTGKNTLSSSKKPLKIAQNDQKVRLLFDIFPFWHQMWICLEKLSRIDTSNAFLGQLEGLLWRNSVTGVS